MSVSTHILDTAQGRPAAHVAVTLERKEGDGYVVVNQGATDSDGRIKDLLTAEASVEGEYRATFAVREYFARQQQPSFYPEVQVQFTITNAGEHYHVPLLLSPYGYSTYRGS